MKIGAGEVWSLQPFLSKRHATAWRTFLVSSRSKPELSGQPYTRSETAFNADFREVLKAQGLGVLHIRETDTPGAFDLLVTIVRLDWPPQHVWIELKVMDEEMRPSQVNFHRERKALDELTLVARLLNEHTVSIRDGLDREELLKADNFYAFSWRVALGRLANDFYSEL
jgi:hypothetical protein